MIRQILCAGSLNVDLTFPVPRMPEEHEKLRCGESGWSCGGSAANTAYWLARLGIETRMLGCVGDDVFGRLCLDSLRNVGVDLQLIQCTSKATTGMAAILVNPNSKRMVTSGGANAHFEPGRVPASVFGPDTHLHVATSLRSLALPLLQMAKQTGASTSSDMDGGPGDASCALVDYCLTNRTDLTRWHGSAGFGEARERLGSGSSLIVTQGGRGATALSEGAEVFASAFNAQAVDRTGGGDAFDAGFLYALARGCKMAARLRLGLFMAAGVIGGVGARPDTVDLDAVCRLAEMSD
jgi:sugar/nucleoside kinase (ribokinase family)